MQILSFLAALSSPVSAQDASGAATARALDRVVHVPPDRAFPEDDLLLYAEVPDIAVTGALQLYWRPIGEQQWNVVVFDRAGDRYQAVIPGRAVHQPGVEYAIVTRQGDDRARPRFASPERPHAVYVSGETIVGRERRLLAEYGGHRSTAMVYGGGASYGTVPGASEDRQLDVGAGFIYRPLTTLHALEFHFDRTRGTSPLNEPGFTNPDFESTGASVEAGYDRGSAAAHFAPTDGFGIRVGAELGVDLEGFTAGGGVGLCFGAPTRTHVWVHYNGVAAVGQTAGLSLTWDTVPRVPMTAGVDVTTWPAGQAWATRLRYGLQLPLGDQLGLDLEASYQARSALAGGAGGKGGVSWSF